MGKKLKLIRQITYQKYTGVIEAIFSILIYDNNNKNQGPYDDSMPIYFNITNNRYLEIFLSKERADILITTLYHDILKKEISDEYIGPIVRKKYRIKIPKSIKINNIDKGNYIFIIDYIDSKASTIEKQINFLTYSMKKFIYNIINQLHKYKAIIENPKILNMEEEKKEIIYKDDKYIVSTIIQIRHYTGHPKLIIIGAIKLADLEFAESDNIYIQIKSNLDHIEITLENNMVERFARLLKWGPIKNIPYDKIKYILSDKKTIKKDNKIFKNNINPHINMTINYKNMDHKTIEEQINFFKKIYIDFLNKITNRLFKNYKGGKNYGKESLTKR